MKTTTPEAMGISSADILNYVNLLEEYRLATHNVIIARGDSIIYEQGEKTLISWKSAPPDNITVHIQ